TDPLVDPLTGARSRGALERHLYLGIDEAALTGSPYAVFLLDVDWFKSVNDVYGHARGDLVLRHVVDRLRRTVRASDEVFRYGGGGRAVDGEDGTAGSPGGSSMTRLLDRDAEVAAVLEFLDRLPAARRGTLYVFGPPASGRTRFLAEVSGMARLRGFAVMSPGA